MNAAVKATDDFDTYVNQEWKNNNPVPDDYSRWTSFHVLHDRVQKQLEEICGTLDVNSLLGHFHKLAMTEPTAVSSELTALLNTVNSVTTMPELLALCGWLFVNHGVSTFFHMCKGQDDKNPEYYIPQLNNGGISLPDREYYLNEEKVTEFKDQYLEHMRTLSQLVGTDLSESAAEELWSIEKSFAELHFTRVQRRDPDLLYNKKSFADLLSWQEGQEEKGGLVSYFQDITLPEMSDIIVDNPQFYEQLPAVWAKFDLAGWKQWLCWRLTKAFAMDETEAVYMEYFRFWGTVLSGQKTIKPRWKRVLILMDQLLGEELGKTYVERYFPNENKKQCLDMIELLRGSLSQKLSSLDWMCDETKQEALKKLATFKAKIGFPDKWLSDYSTLDWKDTKNSREFATQWTKWDWIYEECAKFYSQVEPEKWHMSPQTINAYYNPPSNEIVFPAGILQKPFFSADYTIAQNFGGIGVVIGHEMTHGFDDQGRKYNSAGVLSEWWTADDCVKFNEKAKVVEEHFDSLEFYNKPLNGKLTLGENIADIGGLKLSLNALQQMQDQPLDPVSLDQFFRQYASIWACTITEQEAHRLLAIDPHSPGRHRVNASLSHIPEFIGHYKVNPGDGMYRPVEDQMSIW